MPDNLYLHMDNCTRENKNKYILALCHLLVEWGVFKKVKLGFLPIGHTHDDCDQMFSCFSHPLNTSDTFTQPDLAATCRANYKPTPLFVHLDKMACWTALLDPLLPKSISLISKPRYFRVKRDEDGVVRHHYRKILQDWFKNRVENEICGNKYMKDEWMPMNSKGYVMFPGFLPRVATLLQVPFKPAPLPELEATVKVFDFYMDDCQKEWWARTLDRFKVEDAAACTLCIDLRKIGRENAKSCKDTKDETAAKQVRGKAAYDEMFRHLAAMNEVCSFDM